MRPPGIGPGSHAWEACILPLNHERFTFFSLQPSLPIKHHHFFFFVHHHVSHALIPHHLKHTHTQEEKKALNLDKQCSFLSNTNHYTNHHNHHCCITHIDEDENEQDVDRMAKWMTWKHTKQSHPSTRHPSFQPSSITLPFHSLSFYAIVQHSSLSTVIETQHTHHKQSIHACFLSIIKMSTWTE